MGALSLLTFFSRKRKLVARLLERYYEAKKAKACETIIRETAITSAQKNPKSPEKNDPCPPKTHHAH
jgi:hypothetical protein